MTQTSEALGDGVHRGPNSVHCAMNVVCSVLNIGPVSFQWKLFVVR